MPKHPQFARLEALAHHRGAKCKGYTVNEEGYFVVKPVVWGGNVDLHLTHAGRFVLNLRIWAKTRVREAATCQQAIDRFCQCFPQPPDHIWIWYEKPHDQEHVTDQHDPRVEQERYCVDVTDQDDNKLLDLLAIVTAALP